MVTPSHCRLCGTKHWSYEPHEYPKDMRVRADIAALTRTKPVTRDAKAATLRKAGTKLCAWCETPFVPKRATGLYHSEACRKEAFRAKEKA